MAKIKVLPPRKYNSKVAMKAEKAIEQDSPDFGSFRITDRQLPAIKTWSVGQKYKFEVETEMTEHSKTSYGMEAGRTEARFKITKATAVTDK